MNGEERKVGDKKRLKGCVIGRVSDDDEPIGALFKVKSKKKPRKGKLGLDVKKEGSEAVGEDDGGMDDTLACFKKKLKGPKKDNWFGIDAADKDMDLDEVDFLCVAPEEVAKDTKESAHIHLDVKIRKQRRVRKPKSSSKVPDLRAHEDVSDMEKKVEPLEALSLHSSDENLEDSLSTFFKKGQSGTLKTSLSTCSIRRGEIQGSDEESYPTSSDDNTADDYCIVARTSNPSSKFPAVARLNDGSPCKPKKDTKETLGSISPSQEIDDKLVVSSEIFIHQDRGVHKDAEEVQKNLSGGLSSKSTDESLTLGFEFQNGSISSLFPVAGNKIYESDTAPDCLGAACNLEEIKPENNLSSSAIQHSNASCKIFPDGCPKALLPPETQKEHPCLNVSNTLDKTLEAASKVQDPQLPGNTLLTYSDSMKEEAFNDGGGYQNADILALSPIVVDEKSGSLLFKSLQAAGALLPSIGNDGFSAKQQVDIISPLSNTLDPAEEKCMLDGPTKSDSIPLTLRGSRKAKKRRHGDMAYEDDVDWEALLRERGHLYSSGKDAHCDQPFQMRKKMGLSASHSSDLEIERAAAVSAGLKANVVSPIEKIKFKEILKRKGDVLEYLECRNKILGLWSKDVSRVLSLTDFGVSDTPGVDESPRSTLARDVYLFLDQSGYINAGIASKKDKAESGSTRKYKLLGEKKFESNSGSSAADSADGVSFILDQVKNSHTVTKSEDGTAKNDNNLNIGRLESSTAGTLDEFPHGEHLKDPVINEKSTQQVVMLDGADNNLPDSEANPVRSLVLANDLQSPHFPSREILDSNDFSHCDSENRKRVIVIGAGPAGLTAARHLQRQGFSVIVLEARNRIGGRLHTDHSSLSVPVDLGASIITGVEADVASSRRPDPSSLVCAQLGLELTVLNSDCPLYDIVTGQKVPADLDESLEAEFNSLLDDMVLLVAQKGEHATGMSLEDGLEYALKRRHNARLGTDRDEAEHIDSIFATSNPGIEPGKTSFPERKESNNETLSPMERRVMDWHFANLEYGCAALLKQVSLPHWNQDDVYGGFGGAHCMIKGGYSAVVESLAKGLPIQLNQVVTDISYSGKASSSRPANVGVSTSNGGEFFGDAVLITVPLGCLKAQSIKFSPTLPQWKSSSIERLGFGVLNKVIMEFPEVFWDDTVDYFGATAEDTTERGRCFMFWNVKKTAGAPVLIALVVGKAAIDGQELSSSDHVSHALLVLRKLFGEDAVPDPVASVVTDWGKDPFSFGAYSYVAVGSSGEDYDILGKPVDNCLFFAGEATCKEHPDTVGGAMMSGLREAVRIIDIWNAGNDYIAEVEASQTAQRQSDIEKNEVKHIIRKLEAVYLSNGLYNSSSTKGDLLREMFFNAKTFSGRLRLAKEMLNLPVESLKSFAGTKDGLRILNYWILDSMGKDGTQLLRHCVRILVLVSTNLLAVRLSGVGKTVKEKVCVHTSRDIRSIASQLVSLWIEVFRKEKASHGGLKPLKKMPCGDSYKAKGKDPPLGKNPVRALNVADNRISTALKKVIGKQTKQRSSKSDTQCSDSKSARDGQGSELGQSDDAVLTEEDRAALAAAEEARVVAQAAAEAYAAFEAQHNASRQVPKIPSFNKFARRDDYPLMDDLELKRWPAGTLGKQDSLSEIDSRNCRVRDWSVDFSKLDSSRTPLDKLSHPSLSNEMVGQVNLREHSAETAGVNSNPFTKAWVDSAGEVGIKDCYAIERWQQQAAAAESEYNSSMSIREEEHSNAILSEPTVKQEVNMNESSVSQVTMNKELAVDQPRGASHIKDAVVKYATSLLMPLYKDSKIDREGYKAIMKKTATKVMEQATDLEKSMAVHEFLDLKRKNKIRAFVDILIERHLKLKTVGKS